MQNMLYNLLFKKICKKTELKIRFHFPKGREREVELLNQHTNYALKKTIGVHFNNNSNNLQKINRNLIILKRFYIKLKRYQNKKIPKYKVKMNILLNYKILENNF